MRTATSVGVIFAFAFFTTAQAAKHEAPAAAPAMPPAAAPVPATAPTGGGTVARAQFTIAVSNNEPTDNLTRLTNDQTRIYFFTELKNMAGAKVVHRWEFDGKMMHEQPFEVGGARWRVWSSKTFDPSWLGEWKVSIVDGSGATLAVQTFSYAKTDAPAVPTPVTAPVTTKP